MNTDIQKLIDLTKEFNKPRLTKRRKTQIIEQATELRRRLIQSGCNAEYIKEAEIKLRIPEEK